MGLLLTPQLPLLEQYGVLQGLVVVQDLQLSPLSPQYAVVLPLRQVLPSQQPLHSPFWMHLHAAPTQLRSPVQGPLAPPQTHLLPVQRSVVVTKEQP